MSRAFVRSSSHLSRRTRKLKRRKYRRTVVEALEERLVLTMAGDTLASAYVLNLTQGTPAELQESIGNNMYTNRDVDLYKINLTAGQTLKIDVDAQYRDNGTPYSSLNSHLRVFNSSGTQVTSNSNALSSNDYPYAYNDSYLSFSPTTGGDYYIGVSSAGNEYYNPNMAPSGYGYTTGAYYLQLLLTASNQSPVANNDSYSVDQDTTLNIPAAGVLTNDTDPECQTLTASLQSGPSHGSLTYLNADGSFQYVPNAGYFGTDSFTYRANDGTNNSNTATVTITIDYVSNEPGDELDEAEVLSLTLDVPTELEENIGDGAYSYADVDIYKVTLAMGQIITVDVDAEYLDNGTPYSYLDSHLRVFNVSGQQLASNGDGLSENDYEFVDSDSYLSFTASTGGDYYIGVSSGGNVSYDPNTPGSGYSYTSGNYRLQLLVTGGNTPPSVANPVSDQQVDEDAANVVIDISDVFLEVDEDDELTVTLHGNSNPSLLTASLSGDDLTLDFLPNKNGVATITLRATDESDAFADDVFVVTVNAVNDSPSVAYPLGNVSVTANSSNTNIDVSNTFADVDIATNNDELDLSVTNSNAQLLTASISGNTLTLDYADNHFGTATVTVTATDNGNATASSAFQVTVNNAPYMAAPIPDTTANEDQAPINIVLSNYFADANLAYGDVLTYTVTANSNTSLVSAAIQGSSLKLTLGPDQHGQATISVRATDTLGVTVQDTFVLTVNSVNDAPVAVSDAYTTPLDTTLTLNAASGVLANDSDVDGDSITASVVSTTTNGSLNLQSNGSLTYTPNPGFDGVDSFRYQIHDGTVAGNEVDVLIFVTNERPMALDDAYVMQHDTTLQVAAVEGVLANDFDNDGDVFTLSLVSGVTHGTLQLNSNGSFDYTPSAGFTGTDEFQYEVTDGLATSRLATVTLAVNNQAPDAWDDTFSTTHDVTLSISGLEGILGNDSIETGETLIVTLVEGVDHGTLTLASDGDLLYVPTAGYVGQDSFTYKLNDGLADSPVASVTIDVVDTEPSAHFDSYFVVHDTVATIAVADGLLVNDMGDPGESLTVELVTDVSSGTLVIASDGSFTYTPDEEFWGLDGFEYRIFDGLTYSEPVPVDLVVTNKIPTAEDDHYFVASGNSLVTTVQDGVLANDEDDEEDDSEVFLEADVRFGTLTLNADGSFTYQPNAGFIGIDEFRYRATDGISESREGVVTLETTADILETRSDKYSVGHDLELTVNVADGVLSNDWNSGTGTVAVEVLTDVQHGELAMLADGSFIYSPDPEYTGSDSFTYRAVDGTNQSSATTVQLNVTNQIPTAVDDAYRIQRGSNLIVDEEIGVITNDLDSADDSPTATLVQNVTSGTLTLDPDGGFVYVPAAGFEGQVTFTYKLTDGIDDSETATVKIDVFNTVPSAQADSYTVHQGQQLTIDAPEGVLLNDRDDEGHALTAALVQNVESGTLNFSNNGSFVYTPESGYVGQATFSYRVNDGFANSATVVVTLTVENAAPMAFGDTFRLQHGSSVTVAASDGVLANDVDGDGDSLTATLVSNVSSGSLSLNGDGSFSYTPNRGYFGPDSFTYKVNDGAAETVEVVVNLEVLNVEPLTSDDRYVIHHGSGLGANVLDNDFDADGDTLGVTLVADVTNGTLSLSANGSFTYTPDVGFVGTDSFTYTTSDGAVTNAANRVIISVTNFNPISTPDSYRVLHDSQLSVDANGGILGNDLEFDDEDDLVIELESDVSHGTLTLQASGSFSYEPDAGYVGTDSFTYSISDGAHTSGVVTVMLEVFNADPFTSTDFYRIHQGDELSVTVANGVLANDGDFDEDQLTLQLEDGPTHGTLDLNADGSFDYTPQSGFAGTDSFTYVITDGAVTTDPITVEVEVTNFEPSASAATYSTKHDQALTVNATEGLAIHGWDADEDDLTLSVVSGPGHGTLSLNANGSFLFTPAAGFYGEDNFTYRVSDGVASADGTVTIVVRNSKPISQEDNYVVTGSSLVVNAAQGLLANDYEVDGDPMTATVVQGPANGTLSLNADGSFTYTPPVGYVGSANFTYRVADGTGETSTSKVNVSVTTSVTLGAPIAVGDGYRVHHNQILAGNVTTNDLVAVGGTPSVALGTDVSNGTLVLNSNGTFTYTPDVGFLGFDFFTYTLSDGTGTSNPATVMIEVWNAPPLVITNGYYTKHDTSLSIGADLGVLANDLAGPGETLTATLVDDVSFGSLAFYPNGMFVYVPDPDFVGTDVFTYTASDGLLSAGPVAVYINVWNEVPVARPNSYRVLHDSTLNVAPLLGVLGNDYDNDGDPIAASLVTGVSHGSLSLGADGSFSYTPNAGYSGADSFTYRITDGVVQTGPVTVNISVLNQVPVANGDEYRVHHDGTLTVPAGIGLLADDWDGNGDAISISSSTAPAGVALNANGSFTYTPPAGFVGTVTFTYRITDGVIGSQSNDAQVSIEVWNSTPWAHDNYYSMQRGATLNKPAPGVLGDDRDWDGDSISAIKLSDPSHGTLAFPGDGSFVYTPDSNFSGTDSFTYAATDGIAISVPVTVTIDVLNNAPWAVDDLFSEHHTQLTISGNLLANDWDPEGKPMHVIVIGSIPAGLSLNTQTGSFTFNPQSPQSPHWVGARTLTYRVSDGDKTSVPATATFELRNAEPYGVDDYYKVKWGNTLTAPVSVLDNDFDPDGDTLQAFLISDPANGNITSWNNGNFVYQPNSQFSGLDTFQYQAFDGAQNSELVTVTINVMNSAPIAMPDTYGFKMGTTLNVPASGVLDNDYDFEDTNLTAHLVEDVKFGTLTLNANGSFTYTPDSGFFSHNFGFDSFKYKAKDGLAEGNTTSVFLTIKENPQHAYQDYYHTHMNQALNVPAEGVLQNDWTTGQRSDMESVLVSGPYHGQLSLQTNGAFVYTPNNNFTGEDTFVYKLDGTDSEATVFIKVYRLEPTDDQYGVVQDRRYVGNVMTNDFLSNGDAKHAELTDPPANGQIEFYSDGSFAYFPNANFVGNDTFKYQLTNGFNDSANKGTVTISVSNAAPVANADQYSVVHDRKLWVKVSSGVLANDTDENDGAGGIWELLQATVASGPSHGSLALQPDGSFEYTPYPNWAGVDSFTYTVSDGIASHTGTVTINVTNSAPIAANATYSFGAGGTLQVGGPSSLTGSATDAQLDPLTATITVPPTNGTLTVDPSDYSFIYTANTPNFAGDSFQFTVTDNTGAVSAPATITISGWHQLTVTGDDNYMVLAGYTLNVGRTMHGITASIGESRSPTNSLQVQLVQGPSAGSLNLNSDGSFTFSHPGCWIPYPLPPYIYPVPCVMSFTYKLVEPATGYESGTNTVDITVIPVSGIIIRPSGVLLAGESKCDSEYGHSTVCLYNAGPGAISYGLALGTATVSPAGSGLGSYEFSASNGSILSGGNVLWSGDAASLKIHASRDVNSISITGDLFVYSSGGVGSLQAGGSIDANAYTGLGSVNAGGNARVSVMDGSVGSITAGGAVTRVSAFRNTMSITAGAEVRDVFAGGAMGGAIQAGTWIGSVWVPSVQYPITASTQIGWVYTPLDVNAPISAGGIGLISQLAGRPAAIGGYVPWEMSPYVHTEPYVVMINPANWDTYWFLNPYHFDPYVYGYCQEQHMPNCDYIAPAGSFAATAPFDRFDPFAVWEAKQSAWFFGGVYAGRDVKAAVTATSGNLMWVHAGRDITASISAPSGMVFAVGAGRDITAAVSAMFEVTAVAAGRDMIGPVTSQKIGYVSAYRDLIGAVTASYDRISRVWAGRNLSAAITAQTDIWSATALQLLSGAVTATLGHIDLVDGGTITGAINAGGDIELVTARRNIGSVTAGGAIDDVNAGETITAAITANGGGVDTVTAGGNLSSGVRALGGNIGTITVKGNMSGTVEASANIDNIDVGGDASSSITAGVHLGTIEIERDATGAIEATAGNLFKLLVGRDLTGDVYINKNITDIVAAGRDIQGYIVSDGWIKRVRAGRAMDDVRRYGGNISGSMVYALEYIETVETIAGPSVRGEITAEIMADTQHIVTVSAADKIEADISANTYIGSVTAGTQRRGGITGDITAHTTYITTVTANHGMLNGDIKAGTTIGTVFAHKSIMGDIDAGTDITQIVSHQGGISGQIIAGDDIEHPQEEAIRAGWFITSTIKAGGDIGEILSGWAVGGSIEGDITAGGDIEKITALGEVSLDYTREVWRPDALPKKVDLLPNHTKVSATQRPRPGKKDLGTVALNAYITGKIKAHQIGPVTAFGSIQQNIEAGGQLGKVWALGSINGDLKAGSGSIEADAWGGMKHITAPNGITARAYDSVTGTIDGGAGKINLTTWKDFTGEVKADDHVIVWAYGHAKGKFTSKLGGLNTVGMESISGDTKAALEILVHGAIVNINQMDLTTNSIPIVGPFIPIATGAFAYATGRLFIDKTFAFTGKKWAISLGDISGTEWEIRTALQNAAPTLGPATTKIVALGKVAVKRIAATDVEIYALEDVKTKIEPNGSVKVEGRNVDVDIVKSSYAGMNTYAGSVDVQAYGQLDGDIYSGGPINVMATRAVNADMEAVGYAPFLGQIPYQTWFPKHIPGWIGISAGGDVKGEIEGQSVGIQTWGDLTNKVTATKGGIDVDVYGNSSAEIHADGFVRVKSWSDVSNKITSDYNYVEVFAANNSSANIKAGSVASVEAWGNVSGRIEAGAPLSAAQASTQAPLAAVTAHGSISAEIISPLDAYVEALGKVGGNVTATAGSAYVEALQNVNSQLIKAGMDVEVTAFGQINVGTVEAGEDATLWGRNNVSAYKVTGGGKVEVMAGGNADVKDARATEDDVEVFAVGNVNGQYTATKADVEIVANLNMNVKATANGGPTQHQSQNARSQKVTLIAGGNIQGEFTARSKADVTALKDVNMTLGKVTAGDIELFAKGLLDGAYEAFGTIDGIALASSSSGTGIQGTYDTTSGGITLTSLAGVDATVTAGSEATVFAYGDVNGSVTAGTTADVIAEDSVDATVTANDDAWVSAINESVNGTITSNNKSVTIFAGTTIDGSITAQKDVSTLSFDSVNATITATVGNASVGTLGTLTGSVNAGADVDVYTYGSMDAPVTAGANATVISSAVITGNVTANGGDAKVLSGASISGEVKGSQNATASAVGSVTKKVTATSGAASVLAGADVTGEVHAGTNASVVAIGNATKKVKSGQGSTVIVMGNFSGEVEAGASAFVFAKGTISSGNMTAVGEISVTAIGNINATISSTASNADVATLANLAGQVTASQNAEVIAVGNITVNVTAQHGSIDLMGAADVTNTIDADVNADVTVLGNVTSTVITGSAAMVYAFGGTANLTVDSGTSTLIGVMGQLTANVIAGTDASVLSLGATSATVLATGNVSVAVEGTFVGNLTATNGRAALFATGATNANITAGSDVAVGTLAAFLGNLTAGGELMIATLGQLNAGTFVGNTGVRIWSYAGIAGPQVSSPNGPITALSNGIAGFASLSASGNIEASSLNSLGVNQIATPGNVMLYAQGPLTGTNIAAGGNLVAFSMSNIHLQPVTVGGSVDILSGGNLTIIGTAAGNARLTSYAGILGDLAVGNDITSVMSVGTNVARLIAGANIGTVVSWTDLASPGELIAGGNIGRVNVWSDITADITAFISIGEVTAGELIIGTISAPVIGKVAEGDRTAFVWMPEPLLSMSGEVRAATVEAYAMLLDLLGNLQLGRTELSARKAAAAGEFAQAVSEINIHMANLQQMANAAMADLNTQLDAAFNDALEKGLNHQAAATAMLEGAKRRGEGSGLIFEERFDHRIQEVAGSFDALHNGALGRQQFLVENATRAEDVQAIEFAAAIANLGLLEANRPDIFVGFFVTQLEEIQLDALQETLDQVGTVGDFIPVVGWAVAGVADIANALISHARGNHWDAAGYWLGVIPFAGTLLKKGIGIGVDVAKGAGRSLGRAIVNRADEAMGFVAKYGKKIPVIGDLARKVPCDTTLGKLLRNGCFVGDTEVLYIETQSATWLAMGAGVLVGAPVIVVLIRRRKKRSNNEALNKRLVHHNDPFWLDDEDDPMPELDPSSDSFDELCDHLFNSDESDEFWSDSVDGDAEFPSGRDGELHIPNSDTASYRPVAMPSELDRIPSVIDQSEPRDVTLFMNEVECATPVTEKPLNLINKAAAGYSVVAPRPKNQIETLASQAEVRTQPKNGKKRTRRIAALTFLGIFAWLFLSAFCLWKGFNSPHIATKPIDEIQVGTIVPGDRVHGDHDLTYGPIVDPQTWRHLHVRGEKEDGSQWDADLLMPLSWINEQKAEVGKQVAITVPECGIDGNGELVRVEPCPAIRELDGEVVTGVFRHHSANVMDVYVEGLDEPIGTTANHPFWSVDQNKFVRADELKPGEELLCQDGSTLRVLSSASRPGLHTVYNLQVSVDHVYHVTESGILVHNARAPASLPDTPGVYIIMNTITGEAYVGSAGMGEGGMKSRINGNHPKAEKLLKKKGTVVKYVEVDLSKVVDKDPKIQKSMRNNILRYFENAEYEKYAKNYTMLNKAGIQAADKVDDVLDWIKKFGVTAKARVKCT